jgi:TP901 family phage tail tape measure protein
MDATRRVNGLGQAADGTSAAMFRLQGQMQLVSQASVMAGAALGSAGLLGAKFLVSATEEAMGFGSAMRMVGIRSEASAADLALFRKEATTLAETLPGNATEIARLGEQMVKAGVKITDTEAGIRNAITLATLEGIDQVQAMKLIIQQANIFDKQGENVEVRLNQITSALIRASDAGLGTASELMGVAQRASLTGKDLGISAGTVFAFSAALKDVGATTQVAGTGLAKVFSGMALLPDDFARVAGLATDSFSALSEQDQLLAFVGGLDKIKGGVGGVTKVTEEFKKFAGAGTRIRLVMNSLIDSYGKAKKGQGDYTNRLEEFVGEITKAEKEGTLAAKRMSQMMEDPAQQMKLLAAAWTNLKIGIGETLMPLVAAVTKFLRKIVDAFNKLSPQVKKTITYLLTFGSAMLLMAGAALVTFGLILGLMAMLQLSAIFAATSLTPIIITLAGVTGGILAASAAFLTFAALVVKSAEMGAFDTAVESANNFAIALGVLGKTFRGEIVDIESGDLMAKWGLDELASAFANAGEKWRAFMLGFQQISNATTLMEDVAAAFKYVSDGIMNALQPVVDALADAFGGEHLLGTDGWVTFGNVVGAVFAVLGKVIGFFVKVGLDFLIMGIEVVMDVIAAFINLGSGIFDMFQGLYIILMPFIDLVASLFTFDTATIIKAWDTFADAFVVGVGVFLEGAWKSLKGAAVLLLTFFTGGFGNFGAKMGLKLLGSFRIVKIFMKKGAKEMVDGFKWGFNWAMNYMSGLPAMFMGIIKRIGQTIVKAVRRWVITAFAGLIQSFGTLGQLYDKFFGGPSDKTLEMNIGYSNSPGVLGNQGEMWGGGSTFAGGWSDEQPKEKSDQIARIMGATPSMPASPVGGGGYVHPSMAGSGGSSEVNVNSRVEVTMDGRKMGEALARERGVQNDLAGHSQNAPNSLMGQGR